MNTKQDQTVKNIIVPDCSNNPATSSQSKKRTKRSSKAVRTRKSIERRIYLNKFTAEKIKKSFKVDVIEIDGTDVDFTDAFAFYTWYLENYARLEHITPCLAIKFREQYLAFNLNVEGQAFLEENIRQKFLFDDAYYEKILASDSDESIPDSKHKTDFQSQAVDKESSPAPNYRADSPIYCPTTEVESDSSVDDQGPARAKHAPSSPVYPPDSEPMEVTTPMIVDIEDMKGCKLYTDYGGRRLAAEMTANDFKWIEEFKKTIYKAKTGNVKVRDEYKTVYLDVLSVVNFHTDNALPLLEISDQAWRIRRSHHEELKLCVKQDDNEIAQIVAIG